MQIPTIIRRAAGLAAVGAVAFAGNALADHTHPDVATGSPFHDEVAWLTDPNHQIATGFPDGSFGPKDPVKRQQLAFWMANLSDQFELVTVEEVISSATTTGFATATCPAGKRVLAGGGGSSFTDAYVSASMPGSPSSWFVRAKHRENLALPMGTVTTAVALCGPELANP